MDPQRGTERGNRRDSAGSAAVLRLALGHMAEGEQAVPLDELRRHLSRAERNLALMRLRGGRYRALQLSPHVMTLRELLRVRRMAG